MFSNNKKNITILLSLIISCPLFIGLTSNGLTMYYLPEYGVGNVVPISLFILFPFAILKNINNLFENKIFFLAVILMMVIWHTKRSISIGISIIYFYYLIILFEKLIDENIIYKKMLDFTDILSRVSIFLALIIFMSWIINDNLGTFVIDNIFIYNIQQYFILFLAQVSIFIYISKCRLDIKIIYLILVLYMSYALSNRLAILTIFIYFLLYNKFSATLFMLNKTRVFKYYKYILPPLSMVIYLIFLNNFSLGDAEISRLHYIDLVFKDMNFYKFLFPGIDSAVSEVYSMHNVYIELYKYFGILVFFTIPLLLSKIKIRNNLDLVVFIVIFCMPSLVVESLFNIQAIPFLALLTAYKIKNE